MKRTLVLIVADIVAQNKTKKFTSRELAEIIVKTEPEFCAKKIKKTKKKDKILVFQLMAEIGAQYPKMKAHNVTKTQKRPQKYYYKAPAVRKTATADK